MHLVPHITYPADGTNIVISDGHHINQRLALDVPVTELPLRKVITDFLFNIYNSKLKDAIRVELSPDAAEDITLIGERVLILDLLMEMLQNSKEAGASVFKLTAEQDKKELKLIVTDDGLGIGESRLVHGVPTGTKKSMGWGWSLHQAAMNLTKIGGTAAYDGTGIDGSGAQFVITFLRQMPED